MFGFPSVAGVHVKYREQDLVHTDVGLTHEIHCGCLVKLVVRLIDKQRGLLFVIPQRVQCIWVLTYHFGQTSGFHSKEILLGKHDLRH